jgi:tetratricopeptide (TPR) repeat protein
MELFTVHMGRFIEPGGLTPPVVLPSYLTPERRQALLSLLVSGLGNPPVVTIRWGEDTPQMDGNRLKVKGLNLNTEGVLLLAAVENEQELLQSLAVLPKVPALLVAYDARGRCGVEHHKWLYDLKGMLIEAVEKRLRPLLGPSLAHLDLAFPMHAFDDPLEVLAFVNARLTTHVHGRHEPEASWEAFARVMAEKLCAFSQDDLALLMRLVTGEKSQIFPLKELVERDKIPPPLEDALARLEAAGLVLLLGQKVTLRTPLLRLREPELLERTVLLLGAGQLGKEAEGLYTAYLTRLRPPRLETTPPALPALAGIPSGPGPVDLGQVKRALEEQAEALGQTLPQDHEGLASLQGILLAGPPSAGEGSLRALGLAIRAYRSLEEGRLAEALEDAALARRADPALGPFALAVLAYAGEQALFHWRLEDAIERFQAYLSQGGDPLMACRKLGDVYQRLGQWDRAADFYRRALSEARAAGDRWQEGAALNNLGIVYADQGRWDEAIANYKEALEVFRALGDCYSEAQTLMNLGSVYFGQGRWDEAIANYKEALEVFRALGDRYSEAQTLMNLDSVYFGQGRWDEAIAYYEESLRIKRELGDRYGEVRTLGNLANVYNLQGRLEEAIACYKEALETFRALGDRHGEAQVLTNLGIVYSQQGRWDQAVANCVKALEILRALGDRHGEAQTLTNLGIVYQKQNRCEEAIANCEKALAIFRELGDRHNGAKTLGCLGNVYADQGRSEEAIAYYEKALEIFRELGDRRGEAQTLTNLGNVYLKQGRLEKAISCYEESLRIKRALGDRHGEGQTLANMGLLYERQGDIEKACALWQEALSKLHPDSPEYNQVRERVKSKCPRR